jgi:hypothetical protein
VHVTLFTTVCYRLGTTGIPVAAFFFGIGTL